MLKEWMADGEAKGLPVKEVTSIFQEECERGTGNNRFKKLDMVGVFRDVTSHMNEHVDFMTCVILETLGDLHE